MESTQEQHSTPNTGAVAERQPYRQRKFDEDNGDGERRPYRPRGEGRGSYRGRGNADYEGRPFRSRGGRGRGRGGFNNFNKDNEDGTENEQVAEDTENAYKSRPFNNYNRERGSDQPWRARGRGDFQRGFRGGRGGSTRGGGYQRQNWEEARQLKQEELNSDEEVVNVTP
jgi:hypothetical protein